MPEAMLGALIALLVGAAVLGRIEGKNAAPILPVGDRVAAGMIAACLLLSASRSGSATAQPALAVGTAAPLVFYSVVLTLTDRRSWFTWLVLAGLMVIFVYLAVPR